MTLTFSAPSLVRALVIACTFSTFSTMGGCAAVPAGHAGADADALARAIERSVGKDAWEQTGAVRFGFRGAHHFIWDKQRSFVYVKSGDDEVWLDLTDRSGVARQDGRDVDDAKRAQLLTQAWQWFCNDTFWLNPLVKLFDEGTKRELVVVEDEPPGRQRALKVSYASGGATPGDSYLWLLEDIDGQLTPVAVRMWVSNVPVRGFQVTWEGWTSLSTGAKVATQHVAAGAFHVSIDDPAGAATLATLEPGGDRFAVLVARGAHP